MNDSFKCSLFLTPCRRHTSPGQRSARWICRRPNRARVLRWRQRKRMLAAHVFCLRPVWLVRAICSGPLGLRASPDLATPSSFANPAVRCTRRADWGSLDGTALLSLRLSTPVSISLSSQAPGTPPLFHPFGTRALVPLTHNPALQRLRLAAFSHDLTVALSIPCQPSLCDKPLVTTLRSTSHLCDSSTLYQAYP